MRWKEAPKEIKQSTKLFTLLSSDETGVDFNNIIEDDKNKITKAFGNDLMVANEYYAWAYTLKLRVYGCLENADEMPSIYRRRAKELKDKIENY